MSHKPSDGSLLGEKDRELLDRSGDIQAEINKMLAANKRVPGTPQELEEMRTDPFQNLWGKCGPANIEILAFQNPVQ